MESTGYCDIHGIPIYIGDLIRIYHYTHIRRQRKMYIYYIVGEINNYPVLHDYKKIDRTKYICNLNRSWQYEIIDGLHRGKNGEVITFNERPKHKPTQ